MDNKFKKIRYRIYKCIEKDDSGDLLSRSVDIFIITMIVVNVLIIVLESFFDGPSDVELSILMESFINSVEVLILITFTLEYLLRIFVSDLKFQGVGRSKAIFYTVITPIAILEILALYTIYASVFNLSVNIAGAKAIRFLLLLKIGRYFSSFKLIGEVLKKKSNILAAVTAIMIIVILSTSVFMYYIENQAQPENFPNILSTLWWGVVTLTTVGYGDIYPITPAGRVLAGIVAIAGVGIVALPTGIISSGFLEELELQSLDDDEVFEKGIKSVLNKDREDVLCCKCGSQIGDD